MYTYNAFTPKHVNSHPKYIGCTQAYRVQVCLCSLSPICTFVCVYITAFARIQLRVLCLHYDAGLCVRSLVPTIYGSTCYLPIHIIFETLEAVTVHKIWRVIPSEPSEIPYLRRVAP